MVEVDILNTVPIFTHYISDITHYIRGPLEFYFIIFFLFVLLPSHTILSTSDNKEFMGGRSLD